LKFREKFGIAQDKKIILFLSRLNWKKGLDTLIPAFAEIIKEEPKAVLVLAGPDESGYKKEIIKIINNCHLTFTDFSPRSSASSPRKSVSYQSPPKSASCIFTGMLVGEDKSAALQESDVFVLPSYSENFGNVVLEALYFGLPVIITKYVGISPSINKAGAGLVIEKDEKQLTEAIVKILDNPTLAEQMGKNGKKLVETEFSWPEIAESFIKEYNEIIKDYE
jgi:glycosyltransferase involved in cell wall biosynthesis